MAKQTRYRTLTLIMVLSATVSVHSQSLYINEIMSSNSSTFADEDGDYPDWLELYNSGDHIINLSGYRLSDDPTALYKWQFHDIDIQPQRHLLVFASDKDRHGQMSYWQTITNWGDIWRYRRGDSDLPADWNTIDFDDSAWLSGPSGFGYGDGDDSTEVSRTISLYTRTTFTIDEVENIAEAVLHIDYDDAFVAYLNGIEIARANISQIGVPTHVYETAITGREAQIYQGGSPEVYEVVDYAQLLQVGQNALAIEVHNASWGSNDMTLIPFFSISLINPTGEFIEVPDLLDLPLSTIHTNFKIKSDGEPLILSSPNGLIIDSVYTGVIPTDLSLGRQPDGSDSWLFFPEPTPAASNTTLGSSVATVEPYFSPPGGFYSDSVSISLSADSAHMIIRFTLDGSVPSDSSTIFTNPVTLDQTTVVRARVFGPMMVPSKIITTTYFIDVETSLPVVSLSTTPSNFFGTGGIYSRSLRDVEKPVHVEFFEPDGLFGFSIDGGAKIYGSGGALWQPQRALAIFARDKYGYPELNYQLFPDLDIGVFEAFVLRNGGNEWEASQFHDGILAGIVDDWGQDVQAFRPCIVFINGTYFGIHSIREKINEHFIASHHYVDPDNLDMLENKELAERLIIHGNADHYYALEEYVTINDMSIAENYEYAKTQMDMENFIDFHIAEIYAANIDWPANNVKFWRPRTPDGKWRWIMFDLDSGFGLWEEDGYIRDHIEHASDPEGWGEENWPNPPWSTLLFRRLLENESFRQVFVNRFADYLNTSLCEENIFQRVTDIADSFRPEMPAHADRWDRSISEWEEHVTRLETFALRRPEFVRQHLIDHFGMDSTANVSVDVFPAGAGQIQVNTIIPIEYPWTGIYFSGMPITLRVNPAPGYKLKNWNGIEYSEDMVVKVDPSQAALITAIFEPDPSKSIVINEINYNSDVAFDPEDWVELYNNSMSTIDMSGWLLKDADDLHSFTIPYSTTLAKGEYLILCKDTLRFKEHFPGIQAYVGNFDFGFDADGELIRLTDTQGHIIDAVTYDDTSPWPTEPDGNGATLELRNPNFDNSIAGNWSYSKNHGTPGALNSSFSLLATHADHSYPTGFSLAQNYPNPFNAATIISYTVMEEARVILKVYDVLGREIRTLVDAEHSPGKYEQQFLAGQLASGVYFYVINAKDYREVKKMMLLK